MPTSAGVTNVEMVSTLGLWMTQYTTDTETDQRKSGKIITGGDKCHYQRSFKK
jgi:hypothetical protein